MDLEMNKMTWAFLRPPHALYRAAVEKDFAAARSISFLEITKWLFATTAYYFNHTDAMPQSLS
jgi:hypothetical protein